MDHPRYICVHGHFYQPPRENPWLDVVEVEDSAAPYHDWNERITRECYAPNTRARLLDGAGQIGQLLNNYAWISFNFGPTLLSWMAERAPDVYREIVEADRLSQARRGGHGNALAQNYNHLIMPLASKRDKQTQVAWGIADFRHRFLRMPEGMWLAETAVDIETLEALAEAGIRFTILAPRQARRWRRLGTKPWQDEAGIDPSRAYFCRLPSGRSIALFFLDAIVSHRVAFERLLDDGERFLACLLQGFDPAREHAQLMHIATDGESYGHHHSHGDMALAYALERLAADPEIRLTNYGEFLELHPPEWEVEIHDNSSWSCVHGVERWRSDCGCRMRGEWDQRWRAPLRQALDHLKDKLDHLFGTRGREYFLDPWTARDGYIHVILNRDCEDAIPKFLAAYGHPDLEPAQFPDSLRLLELQLDGLLMFTSCGWFHDEMSGIETVQCLRYAARAINLAKFFNRDLEEGFLTALEPAPSNLARYRNGRGVWEQLVKPGVVDLERVLAHQAISSIYSADRGPARERIYSFAVETLSQEVRSRGGNSHVAAGRLRVRSRRTWNQAEGRFVVIHFGGLDFHAVVSQESEPDAVAFDAFITRLLATYRSGSLADVTNLVAQEFPGHVHRLDDLFRDEQRRIIGIVLRDRFADYERVFERLANQDAELLNRLGQLNYPIPKPMRETAAAYLDRHLETEITRLARGDLVALESLEEFAERGRAWGYRPESEVVDRGFSESLLYVLEQIKPAADIATITPRAERLVAAAKLLRIAPDLWQVQNRLLTAYAELSESQAMESGLQAAFEQLATDLQVDRGLLGWKP
jgi:alpha-amylase/alpha-mannosidase (GH57 family)